jgi:hypothetical protein
MDPPGGDDQDMRVPGTWPSIDRLSVPRILPLAWRAHNGCTDADRTSFSASHRGTVGVAGNFEKVGCDRFIVADA